MARREAVSWKLSAAFSWWLIVILNVLFPTYCWRMRAKITINILEQLTKMVPTWSAVFEISITSEPRAPIWSNKNASKQHQKYDRKLTKMVPKPLQNRSWRGSGGHLGDTLETRCFQDFIFDDFGSMRRPLLGTLWAHFGHHCFDVFFEVPFWWP